MASAVPHNGRFKPMASLTKPLIKWQSIGKVHNLQARQIMLSSAHVLSAITIPAMLSI
jgi:hypothetical protein